MIATIQPSRLHGSIGAPASKSSMQRACAAALLHKGVTVIYNPGHSNDDKAALRIIKALGAEVEIREDSIRVSSPGYPNEITGKDPLELDCGESGLSIRMFTPIAALGRQEITITGSGSLPDRPLHFFDEVLPRLGVSVKSNMGKLPLIIKGPLQPASMEVDGSLSSQFLTGLLMAYGAHPSTTARGKSDADSSVVILQVSNLKSKPYIDLTLDVMRKFGLNVPTVRNYEEFAFSNDSSNIPPAGPDSDRLSAHAEVYRDGGAYTVEGDWSGGAFLLVAGAIAGPILIRGLDLTSTQADKAIVDALMLANAGIAIEAKGIKIHPGGLQGFEFDATDCPDLFPPLLALAAYCNGTTRIKGVSRLIHKESNRALTLQEEFGKMKVPVQLEGDDMIIAGGSPVQGARLYSHHDHRIAMACAVAALGAAGESTIEEALAVRKSYPDFYSDLQHLGASVSLPFQQFNF